MDLLIDAFDVEEITLFYVNPSIMLYCLLYFIESGLGGKCDPVFFMI